MVSPSLHDHAGRNRSAILNDISLSAPGRDPRRHPRSGGSGVQGCSGSPAGRSPGARPAAAARRIARSWIAQTTMVHADPTTVNHADASAKETSGSRDGQRAATTPA